MRRHAPDHSARWQALTYVAIAALAITNAAWFYNWRERAVQHAHEITAAKQARPPQQVVYQYRDPTPPAAQAHHRTALADDEQCA